ncbi:mitochondrial inner membrane protease ATP23 isoform X2 [Brachypodium distachyon]|uniref:mitochondrial inner membrane protease ATP23 isoform X2 n=1 Tax=Brachypodium distachyon TaxID=15368 RepID=UPI0001C6FDD8|nr:mitochondrial inner membrane protease ATP23 isoform X2 [Brachypodium distachyon]|eukprot:XP_010240036.1 mitochondrial inner membrane protease ATP23 isoform X2 [Brachypodium distachyon]
MAAAAGEGDSVAPETTRVEAASEPQRRVATRQGFSPGHMSLENCAYGIAKALKNPTVRFLKERMEKDGCPMWPGLMRAAFCSSSGGYASNHGNVDWNNCAHHACSEIRANHLSGNCHFKQELLRGIMKIRGHEPECVKRRALLSVNLNPNCSEKASEDAVKAVWDICYNDTRPFDKAP